MDSPESRIVPTEDMNTVQLRIIGERFPEVVVIFKPSNIGLYVLIKLALLVILLLKKKIRFSILAAFSE